MKIYRQINIQLCRYEICALRSRMMHVIYVLFLDGF